MIAERVEWMVCHSDRNILIRDYYLQPLIFKERRVPTTIFTNKNWMYHFSKFRSIWSCVCCQYCSVPPQLYYNVRLVLGCWDIAFSLHVCKTLSHWFWVLILGNMLVTLSCKGGIIKYTWNVSRKNRGCLELKLEVYSDNANLLLIWSFRCFQQNNVEAYC